MLTRPGTPVKRSTCAVMRKCSSCGALPRDLDRSLHPRRVEIEAMGRPWKCHVVCMVCGVAVEGKTYAQALNGWRKGL